jgi:cobalt/nickel transport system permease protein
MHDILDDYAQSSALRDTNPRLKLLLGLGAILFCISSATPIAPLFVVATMGLITVTLAKIPCRVYFKLLLIPPLFRSAQRHSRGLHSWHKQFVIFDECPGLWPGHPGRWSKPGPAPGIQNLWRHVRAFFIALTTPMIEIFAVLKSLRIPESVIELSMMIYRYIFVFLDQAAMIHSAQVMRLGDAGLKNSLNSFALLSSVLFLRSWEQGERLMIAMDARCYNGKLDLLEQAGKAKPEALFAVVAYLAAIAAISVSTRDMQML